MKENNVFLLAKPVWIQNKRTVPNLQVGFRCDFFADRNKQYRLIITGATYYRIYLNGEFTGYGPARAGHGYIRYDELCLAVREGVNQLAVEVAGSNCTSFYTLPHSSFLCAEILENDEVICCTGRDFQALSLEKLRNIFAHRYSYQRGYGEVWNFDKNDRLTGWMTADGLPYERLCTVPVEETFIPRGVAAPAYKIVQASVLTESGRWKKRDFSELTLPRYMVRTANMNSQGFAIDEWTENPLEELYGDFLPDENTLKDMKAADDENATYTVNSGEYMIFKLPFNDTGFLKNKVLALQDSKVFVFFAEYNHGNGMVFYGLEGQANIVTYNLKKSDEAYELESFEPYVCQYIGIAVSEGKIALQIPQMREYSYPEYENLSLETEDPDLKKIMNAAINTFRQNTLDVFMDCPGRERAGWLCDSYFTAQSERMFTGKSCVEKVFLENFVMAREFPNLPAGMLPHNYPSGIARYNNGYIPQWAMWYVVELGEYCRTRTGADAAPFRTLCYDLLSWLRQYENEYGLLERMPGWNFVEWSKANDWTQDVNYPTNMLYSRMLFVMAELFGDEALRLRSEQLKKTIIQQSFTGEFFIDNAVRDENGVLRPTKNCSETCQYYAYFFDVADAADKRYEKLTKTLLEVFGPDRDADSVLPQVAPANAFIGNYLRLIILLRMGQFDKVLQDIRGYFKVMADVTGTLWEHNKLETKYAGASLNHGFASYAGVALMMALCGIRQIDYAGKKIRMEEGYLSGINYRICMNTPEGVLQVEEQRAKKTVRLPKGWKLAEIREQE